MEAELRTHLTSLAAEYAGAKKLEMVTVARLATGDWRFFERVEGGASFTARKYDLIVRWFAANWPADANWPPEVPWPDANTGATDDARRDAAA